ncbi:MAG: AmmeMemoRadiSam system radical SAM enzyme [candidate division Zixibacteria bacterium]|nr:AmmeMemoRadiSam system radical SAM enzyme [candidate division Zixibacteria bacterium]
MSNDFKEALLYDTPSNGSVRCNICQRRCEIKPQKLGYCHTRFNKQGKLYSLIYSKVSCSMISPIEKKPLFHFYPGSLWLSLGTLGCNLRCPGCQNWDIAHAGMDLSKHEVEQITPQESIDLAKRHNCKGVSWTYNEPTIWFEYTLDGAKLAKENSLLTNYVTNGFITPEALDMIGPHLDAFRVDIKGFSDEFYKNICHVDDFKGILEVTKRAKEKWGMWVEIITNIIPGYNDDETQLKGIASWVKKELGEFTPWHLTQFVPHLELAHIPVTPVSTLEKAREIGLNVGLKYVYLGNVWNHPAENTHCHNCQKLLIERKGFYISENHIKDGKCPFCHTSIPGRFD